MTQSSRELAAALLAAALDLEPHSVDESMALESTEKWDSLAHLRLVLAIEDSLHRALRTEEVLSLTCFADVASLLQNAAAPGPPKAVRP